jgi:hypothetical protein
LGLVLERVGDLRSERGDTDAATRAWVESLALFTQLNHPRGEYVATKLTEQLQ